MTTAASAQFPGSWSPDGRLLAYAEDAGSARATARNQDIWILPLDGDRKPQPFLNTPAQENAPAFSPNGKWLAYGSDESGQGEVYVRPFPGPGGKSKVPTELHVAFNWLDDLKRRAASR